jgi:hypothetical protein
MSSVVLSGNTSGAVTLAVPDVAGTNTITLPASTGTVMVSGNMPTFRAFLTANQAVSHNTATKIVFDGETFDTNSNFASGRFTPTVAGYYYVMSTVAMSQATQCFINIYKNGSVYLNGSPQSGWAGIAGVSGIISDTVFLNGSTDYVEIYAYQATGISQNAVGGSVYSTFSGSLVRTS